MELLPQPYWASTVNNDGLVAGYLTGSPTYLVWNPDLGTTTDIGGVSPGGNAGGQAKFSADGTKLSGSDMGATASEMATYDMATDTWTTHGGIGGVSDGNISSG